MKPMRIKGQFQLKRCGDGTFRVQVSLDGTWRDTSSTGATAGEAFEKNLNAKAFEAIAEEEPPPLDPMLTVSTRVP